MISFHMVERPAHISPKSSRSSDTQTLSFSAELRRKALHLLALVVPFGMHHLGMPTALYALLPLALLGLSGDVLRAYSSGFNRFIRRVFGSMMRLHEMPPSGQGVVVNGATWVLVSATLLVLVFPLRVVVPIFTMFMVSDAVAAIVGRRWGRHTWGQTSRTVEGSAAFLVTGLSIMACFSTPAFGVAAMATGASCMAEALPGPGNDNVRVPFAGALAVMVLEWLLYGAPVHLFPLLQGG